MRKKTKAENKDRQLKDFLNLTVGDPDILIADGLSDAFIGIARVNSRTVTVYDSDKVVKVLMKRDGMTEDEAWEFYEFNIACAHMGDYTPVFVNTKISSFAFPRDVNGVES